MIHRALCSALFLALVATLVAGCGYSAGSLVTQEHRTIGVPVFDNATRRKDLEWELTRAVVEEIQARTHLLVVDASASPDLMLEGSLLKVEEDVLSRRGRQRIRESSLHLTAEIQVTETATGKVMVERRKVTERESFVPVKGESVRTAREASTRALAERIVRQLESGW
jgi:outer membrane lipopolysaccharide assembly protein LptE/RlpB